MSENASSEGAALEPDKPVQAIDDVKFPPLPEPADSDFDEEVGDEEKAYYKSKFPDLNEVANIKLHCTACDRHLGCSARNESRMRAHPMLKTLICHACHSFYNSGEFDKGEDGSELYCRWCGQGGQVYCCSDCVHVFCAKCIRRNFGVAKIKEIENTDDWKCFKCNPKCLWDMRAICWALLHYCEYRNKILAKTEDPELKEKYLKFISVDSSECCRNKGRKRDKPDPVKKREKDKEVENVAKKIISKMPATIQVKKFASINPDDSPKVEKKAVKRPASPKNKHHNIQNMCYSMQKPVPIAPCNIVIPPLLKKIRLPSTPILNPVRFNTEKKMQNTYPRFSSKPRQNFPIPIVNAPFNGFNNTPIFNNVTMPNIVGDNINLSLETLTQGLDLAAVAAFNNNSSDNDNVVCTPDFPMEPLCEVTEDNDDDVQCITPGPVVTPKINNPPPLVSRTLPDISSENIVQMTENDVTVNTVTGGLKFRVDPQTLSSKKMYRLPDGRIFAINPNPNMPGGYSATIVSVSENSGKVAPKSGETYAAKLSSVPSTPKANKSNVIASSSTSSKTPRSTNSRKHKSKSVRSKGPKTKQVSREIDYKVPVEWYRYNLIDAVDALDYSLSRLNKLKKEATTAHLRSRSINEIKYLHRTLEQLLSTSSKRFLEIRDNLNKELKQFITQKANSANKDEISEDDDVEILPDAGNDDPIFIDENSVDSVNDTQEVDLTGAGSSEHNDSTENNRDSDPLADKSTDHFDSSIIESQLSDILSNTYTDQILSAIKTGNKQDSDLFGKKNNELNENQTPHRVEDDDDEETDTDKNKKSNKECTERVSDKDGDKEKSSDGECDTEKSTNKECGAEKSSEKECDTEKSSAKECDAEKISDKECDADKSFDKDCDADKSAEKECDAEKKSDKESDAENSFQISKSPTSVQNRSEINGENEKDIRNNEEAMEVDVKEQTELKDNVDQNDDKTEDPDLSDELIDSLLQGDTTESVDNVLDTSSLDIPDVLREKE